MLNDCWIWPGKPNKKTGYGKVKISGRTWLAHRWVYTDLVGEIPSGMCVCHKCDVRLCVNPDHLFLGTYCDNIRDMCAKGRQHEQKITHCRNGHEYNAENTDYRYGKRRCKKCAPIYRARRKQRLLQSTTADTPANGADALPQAIGPVPLERKRV